jgi:replication factor C subunit 2/4
MDDAIWLEKYRPQTLDDVMGNEQLVSRLKVLRQEQNVPNMILAGPPGCGKTTSVLALANEILGDNFRNATMELNASDERGIDVVREKVKQFAEKKVRLNPGQHKIIILDEADSLTEAAQQALRMVISDYSDSTRFVFSCNDSTKLIEPIQSRCAILKFKRLEEADVTAFLRKVVHEEHYEFEPEGLEFLAFIADGDMRNALNNLQAVCVTTGKVTSANVELICDVPKLQRVEDLFREVARGKLDRSLEIFKEIWAHEYSPHDLINFFSRVLENLSEKDATPQIKFAFIQQMGRLKIAETAGLGTKIHIMGMLAELVEIVNHGDKKRVNR